MRQNGKVWMEVNNRARPLSYLVAPSDGGIAVYATSALVPFSAPPRLIRQSCWPMLWNVTSCPWQPINAIPLPVVLRCFYSVRAVKQFATLSLPSLFMKVDVKKLVWNETEEPPPFAAMDASLLWHNGGYRAHQHQHSGRRGCSSNWIFSNSSEHFLLYTRVLSTGVDFFQQNRYMSLILC